MQLHPATADGHHLPETTDATVPETIADFAHAPESAMTDGETAADLEIVVGTGIAREVSAGTVALTDVDMHTETIAAATVPAHDPPDTDVLGHQINGSEQMDVNTDIIEEDKMDVDPDADENDMAEEMRRILGFSEFRSTKNTKVPGNNIYGVRKEKKIEYRQYMNRSGGFNRPLSPSR
ncbi:hypothetical protein N7532_002523 [Penicillium argentinense]|uniref:U4/U6.U5 small nuclear ribonucleoprotein 27kDa protein domain-containing protein n=1 Tax=Penicillium argentinense TaxID=1131581 RepID=A0A9W9G0U0_9EURO|nr:uncharacterized protein N7532_002523 [Penicillium argentinense]KAJ5109878.1 hypothetical protein N7532_002523 [Penicillium argentinense]